MHTCVKGWSDATQQKAQKIGSQRKSISSYTKNKIMVEMTFKAKSMWVTKKPTTEKNRAQTTQQFNASKE